MGKSETPPQSKKSKKKKNKTSKFEATVNMAKEKPDKNAPTLGYYPSGFDPLARTGPDSDSLKLYRNQKKVKRIEVVVKPNGCNVDFVGTNYSGEAAAGRMNSFAIGILDKSSQSLTIAPINSNRVFRLQPLPRASRASETEPETPAKTATAEDLFQQKGSLLNRYGTKGAISKAKKAMQLRQKEDPDAEVTWALENTPIDKSAVKSSTSDDNAHDIPPYDLSATTPEKAYLLDKIILTGEWAYLEDILGLLQEGKGIKANEYPSFVCNRYYKLEIIKDEEEKAKLAGIMSYISHLISFKNRYSLSGGSSSNNQTFIPSILLQKFTKMFMDVEKNRIADEKIGSFISYLLVLTLFIDEFQTDFTDIAKDLKMSAFGLRPYFENLGCQFKRRNTVYLAHLPVPLKFPTFSRKRRRG